jgi:Ras-related protein Rab-2A
MQKKKEKGQSQADNKVLFKMIVVGDASVGKSCILAKYTKKEYKMDYNVTIGVEFCSKHVQINNTQVKLQIWDTAGQEAFRSIVGSFYKNAKAVLLIYDITNR